MNKNKEIKEKKPFPVVKTIVVTFLVALTVLVIIFQPQVTGPLSIFYTKSFSNAVIDYAWEHIPAFIKTVVLFTICWVLLIGVGWLAKHPLAKDNKSKTVHSIFMSFIRWLIAIVGILIALSIWGVDTTTLVAGLGIMTLIIGLGAQSLVADILAGFFIVFEEEFEVGDIITIDGWRGVVQEVGMRSTKLIDAGGNLKIIRNSNIGSLINQTKEYSVAKCTMSIEYDENVERVELVFKNNIERIQKAIPAIKEGPYYKGVSELGSSSVNLLFVAKCKEDDIYQVQRDMNRELFLIFNENHINIPFNQVTISQRKENKPDKSGTKKTDSKQAKEFVEEQKEASKDIKDNANQLV